MRGCLKKIYLRITQGKRPRQNTKNLRVTYPENVVLHYDVEKCNNSTYKKQTIGLCLCCCSSDAGWRNFYNMSQLALAASKLWGLKYSNISQKCKKVQQPKIQTQPNLIQHRPPSAATMELTLKSWTTTQRRRKQYHHNFFFFLLCFWSSQLARLCCCGFIFQIIRKLWA